MPSQMIHPPSVGAHMDHLHALCSSIASPTSTMDEYNKLIAYVNQNPHQRPHIPDTVFRHLFLQCDVDCSCTKKTCPFSHTRRWRTSYHFMCLMGKQHLATELHIVLPTFCMLGLDLVQAFASLSISTVPLQSIKSVMFVGPGVVYAGSALHASMWEAAAASDFAFIRNLCPNTTMLGCLPDACVGETTGVLQPVNSPGILMLTLLTRYFLSRLTTVQAMFPFPTSPGLAFSDNLTTLSLHHRYVRTLTVFPQVPVEQLLTLNILKIDKFVAWEMFASAKRHVQFPRVQNLGFEFLKPDGKQRPPTGYDYGVTFPAVKFVKIKGLAHSGVNFTLLFPNYSVNVLHLADSPYSVSPTEMRIFACAMNLEIAQPAGGIETSHSFDNFVRVFKTKATVMGLTVKGAWYPIPAVVKWEELQTLYFKAGIADKPTLANLVRQLRQLKTLVISCITMMRKEDNSREAAQCNVSLKSMMGNFAKVDEMMADDDMAKPLSTSLMRLDISANVYFDWFAVLQLLGRLPNVVSVGVDEEYVPKIDAWFKTLFADRTLNVRTFSDDSRLD